MTVTSSYVSTSTTTTELTASTVTESPTVTTVTSTVTSVAVEPTTVTVPGRSFSLVQTFTDNCVPYNYETLNFGLSLPSSSFEGAFQRCAAKCASYAGCTQIYVSWDGSTSFDCMTGTTGSFGWDASEFQCGYPPIHKNGYWFSASSSS